MKDGEIHAGCLATVHGLWGWVLLCDAASLGVGG